MSSTGERVEGFTFTRHAKYPWDAWTDGSQWKIRQGTDYTIKTSNMQISLHMRARTKKMIVQTQRFTDDEGEGLVFQFSPKEE